MSKYILVALLIFLSSIPVAGSPQEQCTEIPNSFDDWRLIDVNQDKHGVVRWFSHHLLPNCMGVSEHLLLDCREYPIVRGVYTSGESGERKNPYTAVHIIDGRWVEGNGRARVDWFTEVETGKKLVLVTPEFELEPGSPQSREIELTEPCRSY